MILEKIDHVCIAVKNLEEAVQHWTEIFGIEPEMRYTDEAEKINVGRFKVGESALELMQSSTPDGEVARFIEKRGEGIFLMSLKVPNIDETLAELKGKGVRLISHSPKDFKGCRYAFVHPGSLNGVLLELFEGEMQHEE